MRRARPYPSVGRHEGGEGHLLRRKTGMRDVDNVIIRAYPDKEDRD